MVLSEVAKRKEAQRERCKGHRRLILEGWLGDESSRGKDKKLSGTTFVPDPPHDRISGEMGNFVKQSVF